MPRVKAELQEVQPERACRIADNPNYKRFRDTDYYVGLMGDIWHVYKHKDHRLNPYFKQIARCNRYMISYTYYTDTGIRRRTHKPVQNIVWETYRGKIPKGYTLFHINGMKTDCSLNNLKLVTLSEYGTYWAKRTTRTRYVLDMETNKVYIGIAAAAKATYYKRQAVHDHCAGHRKNPRFKYLEQRPYAKKVEA